MYTGTHLCLYHCWALCAQDAYSLEHIHNSFVLHALQNYAQCDEYSRAPHTSTKTRTLQILLMFIVVFITSIKYKAWFSVLVCSENCKEQLLALLCLSVCMEQLGSHWMDFYEIWYLGIFRSAMKIKVSLKSDKNNTYVIWRPVYIYDNISLHSS